MTEPDEDIPFPVILDWYRAERPIELPVWIQLTESTRQAMADAATRVFVERIAALAAMLRDPAEVLSLVDGGEAKRRADLMRAMAQETRRREGQS
jgi:hypothetical protein